MVKKGDSCLLPNFSNNRISIEVDETSTADSIVEKIIGTDWGFATTKELADDPQNWETSVYEFLEKINNHLQRKKVLKSTRNAVLKKLTAIYFSTEGEVLDNIEDSEAELPSAGLDSKKVKQEISLRDLLAIIFGNDRYLLSLFKDLFKSDLFRNCIVLIGPSVASSKIIVDTNDLNSVISYKLSNYYKLIYDYLKKNNLLVEKVASYFDKNGDVDPLVQKNIEVFQEFINKFPDLLKSISKDYFNGDKEFYNAVTAFVSLEYFDKLTINSLGSYLYVDEKQTLPITIKNGKTIYKYKINKQATNLISGWTPNVVRDGMSEMGTFSQLVIELIPLLGTNQTLNKLAVLFACLKLKLAITNLESTNTETYRNRLIEAYKNLSKDSVNAWKEILTVVHLNVNSDAFRNLMVNSSSAYGREKIGLTETDFNVLDSLYTFLFNPENGVENIEKVEQRNGKILGYSIVSSVINAIHATTEANYMEVTTVDKLTTIRLKPKWGNRLKVFEQATAINSKIIREDDPKFLKSFQINSISNIEYLGYKLDPSKVSSSNGLFINEKFFHLVKVYKDEKAITMEKLFEKELLMLSSQSDRQELLDNKEYENFRELIREIDNKLKTNFLSEVGLLKLRLTLLQYSLKTRLPLTNMFIQSAKIAAAYQVNNEYKKNIGKYNYKISSFLKYDNPIPAFNGLLSFSDDKHPLFISTLLGSYMRGIDVSSTLLDSIADAEAIFNGDNNRSVTKNAEGKNMPNVSVLFTDIIQELQNLDRTSPMGNLLFTGVKGTSAIVGTYIDLDVQIKADNKQVNGMNTSELMYHLFVNKFLRYMHQNNGVFVCLPLAYSDKKKFINFGINWKSIAAYKDYANPYKIPNEIHVRTMLNSIGNFYKETFLNIANDYRKMFGISGTDIEVFLKAGLLMKNYTLSQLNKLANDNNIEIFEDVHYRKLDKKGNNISTNELIYYYITLVYKDDISLNNFLNKEKIAYINQLMDNYVIFPVDSIIKSELDQALLDSEFSSKDWIDEELGILILAKREDGSNITLGQKINENENLILNPLLNAFFYMNNVIGMNLKIGLIGHELNHPIKTLNNYVSDFNKKFKTNFYTFADIEASLLTNEQREYLNDIYHQLISSEHNTQSKRTVPIPGTIRLFDLNNFYGIKSQYKASIVSDVLAEVYDFIGKYGYEKPKSLDAHDGCILIDPFTSELENNSLDESRVGDVKKPLWDATEDKYGLRRLVKCASNTITNRIMLQSARSTINMYKVFKKMTNVETFDELDLIDDWAAIPYNENTFNTLICPEGLFYSQNNKYYKITGFGKEIINGQRVYYTLEHETNSNGKAISKNPPYKVYHYFDENSNHIKVADTKVADINSIPSNIHSIRTLFELHAAMGGMYSMSLNENNKLNYSEISNKVVSKFMIYVTKPTQLCENTPQSARLLNQKFYEQPLKSKLINCIINLSAIKNGASNVNPSTVFENDIPLMYSIISTKKYGIQQDSDHTADEGEVTEMSLVISSLDASGLYHDEVNAIYKALAMQTLKAAEIEIETIIDTDNPNKLYELIGKTLINNFKDNEGLTRAILYLIKKNFKFSANHSVDDIKIPFSDPNIYKKILQTLGSVLNKKSIKRKYSGLGQVMVPGYGIYLIWEINGNKYLYLDLLKRALNDNTTISPEGKTLEEFNKEVVDLYLEKVAPNEIVYDKENDLNNLYKIDPTDNIEITFIDLEGNINTTKPINLKTLPDYYSFKDNIELFLKDKGYSVSTVVSVLKNKKIPRDLAPEKVHITYVDTDGNQKTINIFDTWPYKYLNNLFKEKAVAKGSLLDDINLRINHYQRNVIPEFLADLENNKMRMLDDLGNEYEVKITNLQKTSAEVIMSNIYKTTFGIKDGDELPDVNSPEYFEFELNPISSVLYQYDLLFVTKNNAENVYISFDPISETNEEYRVKTRKWKPTNYHRDKIYNSDNKVVNRVYYCDDSNVKQFEVGRDLDVSDEFEYETTTKTFKNKKTKEIETSRNLFVDPETGKVLEYVEFVIKSEIKPKKGDSFIKYNIDRFNLNKVLLKSKDREVEELNSALANIVNSLYKSDSFLFINPAHNIKSNNYSQVRTILSYLAYRNRNNELGNYLNLVVRNTFTLGLNTVLNNDYVSLTIGNTKVLAEEAKNLGIKAENTKELIRIINKTIRTNPESELANSLREIMLKFNKSKINFYEEELIKKIAVRQYSSFKKSQYFVSSRIPALTLQSFMKMECVGFNGVSTNYCAVSHFLAFLQGSDYTLK